MTDPKKTNSQASFRILKLADIPPVKTDKTAGEWITDLVNKTAAEFKKQGMKFPTDFNPFQAEPMAAAVLIGTVDDLEALRTQMGEIAKSVEESAVSGMGLANELASMAEAQGQSNQAHEQSFRELRQEFEDQIYHVKKPLMTEIEALRREIAELRDNK